MATVTLDRPDALNALTRASRRALVRDLRALSGDAGVRCVVLTGAGRAFCAGQDLREENALANVDETIRETYIPVIEALVQMPKPVIAAVNGAAAGAGLSLALACDLRYLAEDAVLMMAFSNIALVPDCGGSWFLPRTSAMPARSSWPRPGAACAPTRHSRSGSCSACCPRDELLPAAHELAATLAARPPLALAWTKRLLRAAEESPLADVMELEAQLQAAAVDTYDHAEGVASFLEKREPRFEGR